MGFHPERAHWGLSSLADIEGPQQNSIFCYFCFAACHLSRKCFASCGCLILWRNKQTSARVLAGATIIWLLFEWLGYYLPTLICRVLILGITILFVWPNASAFINKARAYGWQDTYVFSKAMAEMIMVHGREDLPAAIVRPSVIESTYNQPFPGWIEGNRVADPIITLYGKGHLSCFLGDPDNLLDVIPLDVVVNATLAAMAKHAGKPDVGVYQVASSVANPIRLKEFFDIAFEHFKCNPFTDKKGKPLRSPNRLIWLDTMEDFYRQDLDTASNSPSNIDGLSTSAKYMLEQLKYMAKIYEPYSFYKGRFDISNSEQLFQELSEEERESFGFDVKNIQ